MRPRAAPQRALRRRQPRAGLRHAPRRGHVPRLGAHDVPGPRRGRVRAVSDGPSCAIPPTRYPSCWPPGRTSSGAGTSPSSRVRPSGPPTPSTCCSTSSAATSPAGCWRTTRAAPSRTGSSPRRWRRRASPSGLTIHADRGTSMTSKPVAFLLADLGITKSHSRPHVSNDNPFSEAHFKTLKYRPGFPDRFGSIEDARAFCRTFFGWYNAEHRHSAHRPADTRDGPPRPGRSGPCRPAGRPQRRLRGAPRALRAQASRATDAAERRLDQPAEGGATSVVP